MIDTEWSDLSRLASVPDIDSDRLHRYRIARVREQMQVQDVSLCLLVNPISLRYALEYRCYGLFQSHIPTTYALIARDGPALLYNAYDPSSRADDYRRGRAINYFDGGTELEEQAVLLAADVDNFLAEIGSTHKRIAVEAVNPSLVRALTAAGYEVIDGSAVAERARLLKSPDEIACMRWAIAVAEHGIAALQKSVRPGVTELQLWGILNFANLANNGDWHDGRMLASGPRINPWLQEASPRQLEAGDLVGFDTDMVGPFGYFADISRTLFCGPGQPSARQKQLYRHAYDEIQHNIALIRPGISYTDLQQQAYPVDPQFHDNAYTCIIHAVGMCDEYPRINPVFRGANPYDGTIEAGMVLCVESYVGAVGERDGVKLEEQVLVTDSGAQVLTQYPFDEQLLN